MLSLEESLKILKETNALLEGHFILSSGLHSPQYVQCAQLMSKPEKVEKICSSLVSKIKNEFKDIDLILSPAMGGIIIGYEVGRLLKKTTIFSIRRVAVSMRKVEISPTNQSSNVRKFLRREVKSWTTSHSPRVPLVWMWNTQMVCTYRVYRSVRS